MLYIVAIAWLYVVGLVAIVEALAPHGSLVGAGLTFVGWGVLPLSIVLYILGTPSRRWARRRAGAAASDSAGPLPSRLRAPSAGRARSEPGGALSAAQPDRGGHAASDAVASEREKA